MTFSLRSSLLIPFGAFLQHPLPHHFFSVLVYANMPFLQRTLLCSMRRTGLDSETFQNPAFVLYHEITASSSAPDTVLQDEEQALTRPEIALQKGTLNGEEENF